VLDRAAAVGDVALRDEGRVLLGLSEVRSAP